MTDDLQTERKLFEAEMRAARHRTDRCPNGEYKGMTVYRWEGWQAARRATRSTAQQGEDARDAERYRWLMRQVPSNIADIFHECAIGEVGDCIDDEIKAERDRALKGHPADAAEGTST